MTVTGQNIGPLVLERGRLRVKQSQTITLWLAGSFYYGLAPGHRLALGNPSALIPQDVLSIAVLILAFAAAGRHVRNRVQPGGYDQWQASKQAIFTTETERGTQSSTEKHSRIRRSDGPERLFYGMDRPPVTANSAAREAPFFPSPWPSVYLVLSPC